MPLQTLTFAFATERGTPAALTEHRCKAAVPFGGKYRVIDFILANCLHSGLRQILVLTQYKSHSLHKHLRDGWSLFAAELGQFITPVPPQMRESSSWYAGAIDALRQNRYLIERSPARTLLLLDAGLIYRMDYAELVRFHREQGAGITCALRHAGGANLPAPMAVELADGARIVGLRPVRGEPADTNGEPPGCILEPLLGPAQADPMTSTAAYLATMGVVVIEKALLLEELDALAATAAATTEVTVGNLAVQLLAPLLERGRTDIAAYGFGGARGRVTPDRYWSDLGDTDAYFRANMDLLKADPPLDLYQPDWNIITYQGQYPPARTVPGPVSGNEGIFVNSMLAAGTVIRGGGVSHSVLYPQVQVDDRAIVDEAILCDGVQVGAGAEVRRCICDKDVVISPGAQIGVDRAADAARFEVSPNGIVVVRKGQRV
ncbi:MAG: glucose-1-phosphate adenylyltransferase [Chromatiaceae bacterium]|nr:MAG: glucose-1-phosphate adenylyltransferase [Chromatiaceae bacterium]